MNATTPTSPLAVVVGLGRTEKRRRLAETEPAASLPTA